MKFVDMEAWPRREIFEFFSQVSQPFYSVTFKLDVTRLRAFAKENGLSFYYALVWLSTKAANHVENFRYSIVDGKVALLDRRLPSFTDLRPGSDLFYIVTMPELGDDLKAFCRLAKERSAVQKSLFSGEDTPDLVYLSCLPWLELTAATNERDFDPDDCVPRIAWGKYVENQGLWSLQMSLEVNHRMIDGVHIGQFHEALASLINAL